MSMRIYCLFNPRNYVTDIQNAECEFVYYNTDQPPDDYSLPQLQIPDVMKT